MTLKECLHVNRPLIPLKILMFMIHGGIAALLPYMTIHMKDLGISASETSLILTVLPFVSAIGPPIGGTLADKIGNYRIVFAASALISVGLHLVLFFAVPISPLVPTATNANVRIPVNFSTLDLGCSLADGQSFLVPDRQTSLCGPMNTNFTTGWNQEDVFVSLCNVYPRSKVEIDLCGTNSIRNKSGRTFKLSETMSRTQISCGKLQRSSSTQVTCIFRCQVASGSSWTCPRANASGSSLKEDNDGQSHWTVLAIYSALRLVSTTIMWMAVPLLDALAITMSKQYNGQLGRQKMFSQLAFCVMPLASGALIAVATKMHGFPDYGPAFYLLAIMHGLAAFLIFSIKVDARLPAVNLAKNMRKVMADRRVVSLACAVFFCGCGFGFNTSFMFWFMEEDLHSTKLMLGLSQAMGGVFGIPAMFLAAPIIKMFGHSRIFALSIILYTPRFLAMSFIPDGQAYWVCVTQTLEAISHSLMIVTAADYAGILSPKYVASLQGIIFAAHYCFGKGAGSLIGGQLLSFYGARVAFQAFAAAYAVLFVVYISGHYFFVVQDHRINKGLKKQFETDADDDDAVEDIQPANVDSGSTTEKGDGLPTNEVSKDGGQADSNASDRLGRTGVIEVTDSGFDETAETAPLNRRHAAPVSISMSNDT